jgi:foldase protein PrsA
LDNQEQVMRRAESRQGWPYWPQVLAGIGLLLVCGLWLWWSGRGDWVYRVNGAPISRAEWQRELAEAESFSASQYGVNLEEPGQAKTKQEISKAILQNLVENTLLLQAAARAGISADPRDVENWVDNQAANVGGLQRLDQILKSQGSSLEELRRQVADDFTIITLKYYVTRNVTVSEAEIGAEYQAEKEALTTPARVKVGRILVATKGQATALIDQLERATAANPKLDLGAYFQKLADSNSIDPGVRQDHGVIGYITGDDPRLAKGFTDAAFATPVGAYTRKPVPTGQGWYVLYVFDKKPSQVAPYEEVRGELQQNVLARKQKEVFYSYLQGLWENSLIIRRVQQRDIPPLY